jgi:DNA ligase-1
MGILDCHHERGALRLPALGLWLDPPEAKTGAERVFVSHAHSDHTARHREVILTEATGRLLRGRLPGERVEHRLAWRAPAEFRHHDVAWRITLLPAGHVLGSAMALVEADEQSLLYTGDFKLRPGRSAEPCQPVRAETLIMETTFGRPHYRFPPADDVIQGVVRFCRECLGKHEVPVLLAYSLGKSQEILLGLGRAGLPIAVHPQVDRMARIYEECGQPLPDRVLATPRNVAGRVVVCPPGSDLARLVGPSTPARRAVLTGWALDPGCAYRYGAEAAFPLSDHADFDELIEFVKAVAPRRILTVHGFAAEFAARLRDLGFDARAASPSEQLTLPLGPTSIGFRVHPPPARPEGSSRPPHARDASPGNFGPDSFGRFAEATEAIGLCADASEKRRSLDRYLRELSPDGLPLALSWLTGRPLPGLPAAAMALSPGLIRGAACLAADVSRDAFAAVFAKHADPAGTVAELLARRGGPPQGFSLSELGDGLRSLTAARGTRSRELLLASIFHRCRPEDARILVRILSLDLRLGLPSETPFAAVAARLGVDPRQLRRAGGLLGDPAEAVVWALAGRLAQAAIRPLHHVTPMQVGTDPSGSRPESDPLSGRLPDGQPVWVEDWPRGRRSLLHSDGSVCRWFDADGGDISEDLIELTHRVLRIGLPVVLDGHLVSAGRPARRKPQPRRDPHGPDLFGFRPGSLVYVASDLLWADGKPWIDEPWVVRRRKLAEILGPSQEVAADLVPARGSWGVGPRAVPSPAPGGLGTGPGEFDLVVKSTNGRYLPGDCGEWWWLSGAIWRRADSGPTEP